MAGLRSWLGLADDDDPVQKALGLLGQGASAVGDAAPPPAMPSYNDPTSGGTLSQPLPSSPEPPYQPSFAPEDYSTAAIQERYPSQEPQEPAAPPWASAVDLGNRALGAVGDAAGSLGTAATGLYDRRAAEIAAEPAAPDLRVPSDTNPLASDLPRRDPLPVLGAAATRAGTGLYGAAQDPQNAMDTVAAAGRAAATAGMEAATAPADLTTALPSARGLKIVQDAINAGGTEVGRRVGRAMGLTDQELFRAFGMPVSGEDIAGLVGGAVLDPTNYIGGGEARAAARGAEETARGIGSRIRGALDANAVRVGAADARMAGDPAYASALLLPEGSPLRAKVPKGGGPFDLLPEEAGPFAEASNAVKGGLMAEGSPEHLDPSHPVEWLPARVKINNKGQYDGIHDVTLPGFRTAAGEVIPLEPPDVGPMGSPVNSAYNAAVKGAGGRNGYAYGRFRAADGALHTFDSPQEVVFMHDLDNQVARGDIAAWWPGEKAPQRTLAEVPYYSTNRDKGGVKTYNPDFIVKHNDGSLEVLEAKPGKVIAEQEEYGTKAKQVSGHMGWSVATKAAGVIAGIADQGATYRLLLPEDARALVPKGPSIKTGRGTTAQRADLIPGVDVRDRARLASKTIGSEGAAGGIGREISDTIAATSRKALDEADRLKALGMPPDQRLERLTRLVRDDLLATAARRRRGATEGQTRAMQVAGSADLPPSYRGPRGPLSLDDLAEYAPDHAAELGELDRFGARLGPLSVHDAPLPDGTTVPRLTFTGTGDPQAPIRAGARMRELGLGDGGVWYHDAQGPYRVGQVALPSPGGDFEAIRRAVTEGWDGAPDLHPRYNSEHALEGIDILGRSSDGSAISPAHLDVAADRIGQALADAGLPSSYGGLHAAEFTHFAGEAGHAATPAAAVARTGYLLGLEPVPRTEKVVRAPKRGRAGRGRAAAGGGGAAAPEAAVGAALGDVAGSPALDDLADLETPAQAQERLLLGVTLMGPGSARASDRLGAVNRALAEPLVGATSGAYLGAGAPAEDDDQRRRNALIGAGLGLAGGPLASRAVRSVAPRLGSAAQRAGGTFATLGASPGDEAARAARYAREQRIRAEYGQAYPDIRRDVQGAVRQTLGEPSAEMLADSRYPRDAVHPDIRAAGIGPEISPQIDQGGRQNAALPFDPSGAALGAGAGAASEDDQGQQADPWRTAGGLVLGGVAGKRFPGVEKALARAQAGAASRAARMAANPELRRPSAADWFKSLGFSGIYGPATAASSVIGGAQELLLAQPKEALRALVEGRPVATGAQARRQVSAVGEGLANFGRVIMGSPDAAAAASGGSQGTAGLSARVVNPAGHAAARVLEKPGEILTEAPDALFRPQFIAQGEGREAQRVAKEMQARGSARGAYAEQLMADAAAVRGGALPTLPATQRVLDAGKAYADQLGYKGKPGKLGQKLADLSKDDGPVGVLASFLMPFPGMASRMTEGAARITPGVGLLPSVRRGQASRFDVAYDQGLGALAAAGIGAWAMQGGITGSGPDDPEKRQQMLAQGWQPNSVLVGDHFLPSRAFGKFQALLDTAGELHDGLAYGKKDRKYSDIVGDMVKRASKIAVDQTGLSGLADLHDLMSNADAMGPGYAARAAVRYLPWGGTLRAAAAAMDPVQRRASKWGDEAVPTTAIGEGIETAIPGLRQNVAPAQDVLGRPMENPQQGLGAILPRTTTLREDPLIKEFQAAGVDIAAAPSDVDGVPLSAAQQRRYTEVMGRELQRLAGPSIASGTWRSMDPATRKLLLETFQGTARTLAGVAVASEGGQQFNADRTKAIIEKAAGR